MHHRQNFEEQLADSMEQSPSWEGNRFSVTQEISRVLWNRKVHHRIYKSHLVLSWSQIDPAHAASHFSKIHFNIILPFCLDLPTGLLPLGFRPRTSTHLFSPHTCYMPWPSQSSLFDHPDDILWGVQSIKLLVIKSSPLPCHLIPLRPKYCPQHPVFGKAQPTFLP